MWGKLPSGALNLHLTASLATSLNFKLISTSAFIYSNNIVFSTSLTFGPFKLALNCRLVSSTKWKKRKLSPLISSGY